MKDKRQLFQNPVFLQHEEEEEMIQKRLKIAKSELLCQDKYDYKVVNDNLDDCVNDIEKILCEELKKRNK